MVRGYHDFARLHALHRAGIFFVIRAKSNLKASRVYSRTADRATGDAAARLLAGAVDNDRV